MGCRPILKLADKDIKIFINHKLCQYSSQLFMASFSGAYLQMA